MKYTEDKTLMIILRELSRQVDGLYYTLNSDWSTENHIVENRKKEVNRRVDELRRYLLKM
jgi:hypothetical protein